MTSRDFCYWLQGYFELGRQTSETGLPLNGAQVETIKRHLALVFKHEIDPSAGAPAHQAALNEIHDAGTRPPAIGGVDPITGMTFRC